MVGRRTEALDYPRHRFKNKILVHTVLSLAPTKPYQAFRVKEIKNSAQHPASAHNQSSGYFQHSLTNTELLIQNIKGLPKWEEVNLSLKIYNSS